MIAMDETSTGSTPGRIGLALASAVLVIAAGIALGILAGIPLVIGTFVAVGDPSTPVLVAVSLAASQAGLLGAALAYRRLRRRVASYYEDRFGWTTREHVQIGAAVPDLRELGVVALGWIAAVVGFFVSSIVLQTLAPTVPEEAGEQGIQDVGTGQPELLLLLIPVMFLVVAPIEEFLFRGVVQGRLREVLSRWPGVLLASALFTAIHYLGLSGGRPLANVAVLSVLLVPAVVFGVVYEVTGNLVVPVLVHALYNSTLVLLLYVVLANPEAVEQEAAAIAVLA